MKLEEHLRLLSQLKVDRTELLSQLEDEKRKNEDLQFRFEEAAITTSDVEVRIVPKLPQKSGLIIFLQEKIMAQNVSVKGVTLFLIYIFEIIGCQ